MNRRDQPTSEILCRKADIGTGIDGAGFVPKPLPGWMIRQRTGQRSETRRQLNCVPFLLRRSTGPFSIGPGERAMFRIAEEQRDLHELQA